MIASMGKRFCAAVVNIKYLLRVQMGCCVCRIIPFKTFFFAKRELVLI